MAIAVYFHPHGLSLAQFDEVHERLKAVGGDSPSGRIHHSCIGEDGDLMVYDVWDSEQNFASFGDVLMPILADLGIEVGAPDVMKVHSLEQSAV